jgi:uncharacterized protein YndB with AHSA1/START domain
MKKEIRKKWFFRQPPEEVWEYLIRPDLLGQWLMKNNFRPIIGHKFQFIGGCSGKGEGVAWCQVVDIEPFKSLSYSWQANSVKDGRPFNSMVEWTLSPKDSGTELQLVHSGFTVLEDALAHEDGWTRIGNKIVELLNAIKI